MESVLQEGLIVGGVGAEVLFAAWEPLECKGPHELFLELAENTPT